MRAVKAWIKISQLLSDILGNKSYNNLNRKAANFNFAKALTKCGDFIYSGKGCGGKRDKSEAFKCYLRAAQLNEPEAMNNLGLMLENGYDEKMSDPDQALEYYKRAHKMGNTDATINIAIYYLNVKTIL